MGQPHHLGLCGSIFVAALSTLGPACTEPTTERGAATTTTSHPSPSNQASTNPIASVVATPTAAAAEPLALWAQKLPPLLFRDMNTLAEVTLRLYTDQGVVDESAAAEMERVLWSSKDETVPRLSRRLLQLVVKAATHFGAQEVHVVSTHRGKARKGSRHRSGEAIDFLFPNVPAKTLAEHLRTFARVGVGLYVHPRAQYIHLDVREQSYHWIDGSPPGRSWKEHGLADVTAEARDAAYKPEQDLPENAN